MCSVVWRQVTADITTTIMTHRQVPVVTKTRTKNSFPHRSVGTATPVSQISLGCHNCLSPFIPPHPRVWPDWRKSLLGPISVCSVLLTAALPSVKYLPQWSTVDVELTSPLPKLRALKRFSLWKTRRDRSWYSFAWLACCQGLVFSFFVSSWLSGSVDFADSVMLFQEKVERVMNSASDVYIMIDDFPF